MIQATRVGPTSRLALMTLVIFLTAISSARPIRRAVGRSNSALRTTASGGRFRSVVGAGFLGPLPLTAGVDGFFCVELGAAVFVGCLAACGGPAGRSPQPAIIAAT